MRPRGIFSFAARLFAAAALSLVLAACTAQFDVALSPSTATRDITALLETQSAAWNRGDLDAFMQAYAPIDDLRFASGDTVTYGWRSTLERYKTRYPDRATMGTLAFTKLVVTELSPDAAIAFGRWQLTRAHDRPHGLFTLTLRKTSAGWRIVADHTSAATS
jgi:ketosteroid isomerase-like protein